ncbi:MAG: DUF2007 domain-containing protein [Deltaproteobacteria bacterium]|nr:DUF2007 domain-containing protein [Deltaproteobacteria bacterium]
MSTAETESESESAILVRTSDAMRARMIRALLEEEGIPVATPGLEHHSLMPHVGAAIEIVVRVPQGELDRAKKLVTEMEREVDEEPVPSENAPYREAAKKKPAPLSPRLKRIAVVATFLCPGGGHFYVQRPRRAFVVIAGYVAAFVAMGLEVPMSGYLLAVPWLADVIGGIDGCEVAAGTPDTSLRRFASFAAHALIALWSVLALGPLLPLLAGEGSVTFCSYLARCEAREEHRCLLDAANAGPALPEPVCLACIRREETCEAVVTGCQEQCWPEPEPAPFDPYSGFAF